MIMIHWVVECLLSFHDPICVLFVLGFDKGLRNLLRYFTFDPSGQRHHSHSTYIKPIISNEYLASPAAVFSIIVLLRYVFGITVHLQRKAEVLGQQPKTIYFF